MEFDSLKRLINRFEKLPGIGAKTAKRLAYSVINMPKAEVDAFAQDLVAAREKIRECEICGAISDKSTCYICDDDGRDNSIICVVAFARDVLAIESAGEFRGLYHVLKGNISPVDGVSPEDIRIKQLIKRVEEGNIKEVILATNPDIKGEATAAYIAMLLRDMDIKVTRIAYGIPVGGDVEYTDQVTLNRAFAGRQQY